MLSKHYQQPLARAQTGVRRCLLTPHVPCPHAITVCCGLHACAFALTGSLSFTVGQRVDARRLRKGRSDWCIENLRPGWFAATIEKVCYRFTNP